MPALARVFTYVFLVAPCRLHHRGEEIGGATPWIAVGASLGIIVIGSFVGWLTALVWPDSGVEPIDGAFVAVVAHVFWGGYYCLLFGVLYTLGREPEDFVGDQWRRRRRR